MRIPARKGRQRIACQLWIVLNHPHRLLVDQKTLIILVTVAVQFHNLLRMIPPRTLQRYWLEPASC